MRTLTLYLVLSTLLACSGSSGGASGAGPTPETADATSGTTSDTNSGPRQDAGGVPQPLVDTAELPLPADGTTDHTATGGTTSEPTGNTATAPSGETTTPASGPAEQADSTKKLIKSGDQVIEIEEQSLKGNWQEQSKAPEAEPSAVWVWLSDLFLPSAYAGDPYGSPADPYGSPGIPGGTPTSPPPGTPPLPDDSGTAPFVEGVQDVYITPNVAPQNIQYNGILGNKNLYLFTKNLPPQSWYKFPITITEPTGKKRSMGGHAHLLIAQQSKTVYILEKKSFYNMDLALLRIKGLETLLDASNPALATPLLETIAVKDVAKLQYDSTGTASTWKQAELYDVDMLEQEHGVRIAALVNGEYEQKEGSAFVDDSIPNDCGKVGVALYESAANSWRYLSVPTPSGCHRAHATSVTILRDTQDLVVFYNVRFTDKTAKTLGVRFPYDQNAESYQMGKGQEIFVQSYPVEKANEAYYKNYARMKSHEGSAGGFLVFYAHAVLPGEIQLPQEADCAEPGAIHDWMGYHDYSKKTGCYKFVTATKDVIPQLTVYRYGRSAPDAVLSMAEIPLTLFVMNKNGWHHEWPGQIFPVDVSISSHQRPDDSAQAMLTVAYTPQLSGTTATEGAMQIHRFFDGAEPEQYVHQVVDTQAMRLIPMYIKTKLRVFSRDNEVIATGGMKKFIESCSTTATGTSCHYNYGVGAVRVANFTLAPQ